MVSAIHPGLTIQQIKEVVEVVNFSGHQRLVDVLLCQGIQFYPGESLHRPNGKAPGFCQLDSLTVVRPGVPHCQHRVLFGQRPHRQAFQVRHAHCVVVVLSRAIAGIVAVLPRWVSVNQ